MHYTHDFQSGQALDALHSELFYLKKRYGTLLKEETVQGEVNLLTSWIELYLQGSREAANILQEYGPIILEKIRIKLGEAAEDLQRLEGESPSVAELSTGRKAHHLTRASKIVGKAQEHMQQALID